MGNETERRATAAEKRKQALDLRRAGWSYQDIADEVGYSGKGAAHNAIRIAIKEITRESASELIELQLSRLDDLLAGLYEAARNGDLFAVDRALKIEDQRARLLGLYEQKPEDPTADVKGALLDFAAGLKGLFGTDDAYGQVTDDSSGTADVPGDSEPGP